MKESRAAYSLGSRIAHLGLQSARGVKVPLLSTGTSCESLYTSNISEDRHLAQRPTLGRVPADSRRALFRAPTPSKHYLLRETSLCHHPLANWSNTRAIRHSSSFRLPQRSQNPQESSAGSWTAVVVFCVTIAVYSASSELVRSKKPSPDTPREILDDIVQEASNMTGEALAGRPGTLTPEQEEKLKEFWIATLKVFGELDSKDVNGNDIAEPGSLRSRSDTASSKPKKHKKRLSMFRSKGKESDEAEEGAAEDDKYGQKKEFHEALASMSPASLRATFWSMVKHDHPDALLLRFLRARRWDVEKALVMMVSTMRWRSTEQHVDDDIMKNGELGSLEDENGTDPEKKRHGHGFLAQMRMGKSFVHGTDKAGRPMCFVRVRLHKQGEQSEESLERFTVFLIESARMMLSPPVDTACIVFDMTGFSLANMDYTPIKFMIKCFEANYPECLGVVLVHNAPWVFQGIWKIIRGWLDPVVASKVQFTNNKTDIEEFVPASQIIKELGGDEDWTYQCVEPVPGENDLMKDTETRDKLLKERESIVADYEKATLEWIHFESGDATTLKSRRNELANALREDYWKIDPYVRARSYYDRVGMIKPGGRIQFYPTSETKAELPTTNGTVKPVETDVE